MTQSGHCDNLRTGNAAVTWLDFGWCVVELGRFLTGNRKAAALSQIRKVTRKETQ